MGTERRAQPKVGDRAGSRRSLRHDQRGLSTVEYIIILLVVGLVGVAAWRGFGSSTTARTGAASGQMGTLDEPGQTAAAPTAGGGGGGRRTSGRSQLDEATGDAAPPPDASEQFAGPVMLLGAAVLLVLGLVARRMLRKEKKKS